MTDQQASCKHDDIVTRYDVMGRVMLNIVPAGTDELGVPIAELVVDLTNAFLIYRQPKCASCGKVFPVDEERPVEAEEIAPYLRLPTRFIYLNTTDNKEQP